MMRRQVLAWVLAAVALTAPMSAASGEAKSWYDSQGRVTGYDGTLYMTGFGTAAVEGNTPEGAASARSAALADLGSKLKTSIDSSSRITTSEFGKENFSSYQSDVTATVRLDLSGVESYETRYDPKQRRQLALCVLNKAQEQKYLSTQRSQLTSRLESQLREARDYLGKGRQDLLAATLDAMSLTLTDLSANASIDLVLGGSAGLEDSLKAWYRSQDDLRSMVRSKEVLSDSDLVSDLVGAFTWSDIAGARLAIMPALWKTTDISGEYFFYLKGRLEDRVSSDFGIALADAGASDARFVLKGSFFEIKDGYRLVYKLNDTKTGKVLATHEVDLGKRFVDGQKLRFLPENIAIAAADHDRFVAVPAPRDVFFSVYTQKGADGLVFRQDEEVHFYVQVDRPGLVSMVYHLAGSERLRATLIRNYRITESNIGIPVEVVSFLGQLSAQPPFGSETAQFFFSDAELPLPFVMRNIEGVDYPLLSEGFDSFVTRTRGLGAKKPAAGASGGTGATAGAPVVPLAEKSLTITTISAGK